MRGSLDTASNLPAGLKLTSTKSWLASTGRPGAGEGKAGMDDIRLDAGFFDHPKTKRLGRRLGIEGVIALIKLWIYASRYFPKGILTGLTASDVAEAAEWSGVSEEFVSALVAAGGPGKAGFLDVIEGVFVLHNWKVRNRFAYFKPERSAQAQRANDARWSKIRKEKQEVNPDRTPDRTPDQNPPLPPPPPPPPPKNMDTNSAADASGQSSDRGNGKDAGGIQTFFELWNLEAKSLPRATKLSAERKRKIKARLRERSLDEWREVLRRMNASSFLRGESGNGTFRANFDWIIANEGNAIKVIEGSYDDREKRSAPGVIRDVTGKVL